MEYEDQLIGEEIYNPQQIEEILQYRLTYQFLLAVSVYQIGIVIWHVRLVEVSRSLLFTLIKIEIAHGEERVYLSSDFW